MQRLRENIIRPHRVTSLSLFIGVEPTQMKVEVVEHSFLFWLANEQE